MSIEMSIEIKTLFKQAKNGELPEGFKDWDAHDADGTMVAHIAAAYGNLPSDFNRWGWRTGVGNGNNTVAHVAAAHGHLPKDFTNWTMDHGVHGERCIVNDDFVSVVDTVVLYSFANREQMAGDDLVKQKSFPMTPRAIAECLEKANYSHRDIALYLHDKKEGLGLPDKRVVLALYKGLWLNDKAVIKILKDDLNFTQERIDEATVYYFEPIED